MVLFINLILIGSGSVFVQAQKTPQFKPIQKQKETIICHDVIIDTAGIKAFSKNTSDTIETDLLTNTLLYCVPDSAESFWYKIYIEQDCAITFNIFPAGVGNIYNWFLYKLDKDLSPNQIKDGNIAPFRANLCKNEMALAGTGISIASAVNFYDASSKTKVQDFYYTLYHAAVLAKKGEMLVLNVYHIKGVDCGYLFTLNANSFSQKFQLLYKACYDKQLGKTKTQRTVILKPAAIQQKKEEVIAKTPIPEIKSSAVVAAQKDLLRSFAKNETKALFIVRDSAKREFMEAEVYCDKKQNSTPPLISKPEKGKYEILLEKNKEYHLVFSALGYKSLDVFFITTDSARSFTNEVYLSSLQEGDNFVMDKIYFYPNSSGMKPGALEELDKLASYLKANPGTNIEIQGHTNGNKRIKASYEGNFKGSSKKLSQCRADKIKGYLVSNGIVAERLSSIGYGGSKPVFPEAKNQAQANKNIRVEILILSQKETALSRKDNH